jgi:Xaa-Pro aminopeptidase
MSVHEPPFVTLAYSKKYPMELQNNMYLAVETYAGEPGQDSECARLEQDMVITDNGAEIFNLFPIYDEIWK